MNQFACDVSQLPQENTSIRIKLQCRRLVLKKIAINLTEIPEHPVDHEQQERIGV